MRRGRRFALAVIAQMLLLEAIAAIPAWTLLTGTVVVLETEPVDPRDLFRGDYITLNYRVSSLVPAELGAREQLYYLGQRVYVGLEQRGKFWEATSIGNAPPPGIFIRGNVTAQDERRVRVDYGISSFFVEEGAGNRVGAAPLSVEVVLSSRGKAVIRNVFLDGRPLR